MKKEILYIYLEYTCYLHPSISFQSFVVQSQYIAFVWNTHFPPPSYSQTPSYSQIFFGFVCKVVLRTQVSYSQTCLNNHPIEQRPPYNDPVKSAQANFNRFYTVQNNKLSNTINDHFLTVSIVLLTCIYTNDHCSNYDLNCLLKMCII